MRGMNALTFTPGTLLRFLQFIVIFQQTCAQSTCVPSSCGKITNISHPFRLKGDPERCGNSRYELACEDNVTVLTLSSAKYHVQAINYNNFTIRLVDPGIQEADCSSIPRYSLTTVSFADSYDNGYYQYWGRPHTGGILNYNYWQNMFVPVIYLNCSNPVRDDPQYVDTSPSINWHSKGHVYAIVGDLDAGDLKVDCHVKLIAATSAFSRYGSYSNSMLYISDLRNISYPEIHRMMVYGFEVSWMRGACEELNCDQKISVCDFNEIKSSLYCRFSYCESPLSYDFICGTVSKLPIFLEDIIFNVAKGLLQTIGVKIYPGSYKISESKFAIEIGRLIGKYVLSFLIVRYTLGLIFFFGIMIYTCRKRHTSMFENIEIFLEGNTFMPIRYSYKEIKKMTRGFKDKIGEGGYGSVYKGKLRSGPFVAIKMLGKSKANGQEFINEVATIGRIHHGNVVRLVGFCVEASKRALVYEFMPNGSLDRYLFSKDGMFSLTCEQMYKISLSVARGIAYLHQGCDMQILHFDIKPHNILLDENFIPKVSDFGLAKLYPIDNNTVTLTAARGTIGYMAPELFYKNIGGVSYKADVYSFGMLLIEMASRRRNLNPHVDDSSQLFFPLWIYNQLVEEREIELEEVTNEDRNNVKKMFVVGLWCIQLQPCDRPSMNKVIEMLEGDSESIQMPPKPLLYPIELMQGDVEINSDENASNDVGSTSGYGETIIDPLLNHSTE